MTRPGYVPMTPAEHDAACAASAVAALLDLDPPVTVAEARARRRALSLHSGGTGATQDNEDRVVAHPLFPRLVAAVAGATSPLRFGRLRRSWYVWMGDEASGYDAGYGGPRWARAAQWTPCRCGDRAQRLAVRIADEVFPDPDVPGRRVGTYDDRAGLVYITARDYVRAREAGRAL